MAKFDRDELLKLMSDIAPGSGAAEHESNDQAFFLNFLPLPNYRFVLEPDTLLILGGRGAGKTELFRLLARPAGRRILENTSRPTHGLDVRTNIWMEGFGRARQQEKVFPTQDTVERLMKGADSTRWRAFWIGLIVGIVLSKTADEEQTWAADVPNDTRKALAKLAMPSKWLDLVSRDLEPLNYSLDQLDERLKQQDRWLFVTYDELDRLLPAHADLALPIRDLLAFWLDRWRRWERIRPKIFLRTDLFQDEFLAFPDASKLQGHQIRLEWQAAHLYRLLIKRLANSGTPMADYLRRVPKLFCESDPLLGLMPEFDEALFAQVTTQMIGEFMGTSARRGYTYSWIRNHLQDAGGRIAPRSFLKLFSLAAKRRSESRDAQLTDYRLLHPSDLQGALMETSNDRITELQEEYPWLEALKPVLGDKEVPMPQVQFRSLLTKTTWSKDHAKRPPSEEPSEIIRKMTQLGIVEVRSDMRINMPEIYLYGFKLKRRGGIKRPK